MPFKIIQTVENGELCLSIVPGNWEQEGQLRWPKKRSEIAKLSRIESSVPNENWLSMNCILKRTLCTYEEAEQELENMEEKEDTDIETPAVRPNTRHNTPKQVSFILPNFNNIVPQSMVKTYIASEPDYNILSDTTSGSQLQDTEEFHTDGEENVQVIEQAMGTKEQFEELQKQNQKILENQEKILKQLAVVQTALETIPVLVAQTSALTSPPEREKPQTVFNPVNCLEELTNFEDKLKLDDFRNNIIESMKYICGASGKLDGKNCCYKLVDYFITRKFLTQCSWTGNAKSSDKVPLKFFKNFRKCFLDIIRCADKDFTESDCDCFFKTIMKNSKSRAESRNTILSKTKKRPHNLIYKKNSKERKLDDNENDTNTEEQTNDRNESDADVEENYEQNVEDEHE